MTKKERDKKFREEHPDYWKKYYQANKDKYKGYLERIKKQYCKSGEVGRPRGQVRCIETGEIFENSVEASRSIGLNKRAVTNAIHRNGSAGGYHWEYVEG